MKNRLADPSEICALEFKGEFRRFGICSVSATIDIDRSIFKICGDSGVIALAKKDRRPRTCRADLGALGYPERAQHSKQCDQKIAPTAGRVWQII
jgi:hypothetical protein